MLVRTVLGSQQHSQALTFYLYKPGSNFCLITGAESEPRFLLKHGSGSFSGEASLFWMQEAWQGSALFLSFPRLMPETKTPPGRSPGKKAFQQAALVLDFPRDFALLGSRTCRLSPEPGGVPREGAQTLAGCWWEVFPCCGAPCSSAPGRGARQAVQPRSSAPAIPSR